MSREEVWSADPSWDGTDRWYLGQFGQVTGLTFDYNYPGGPDSATWNVAADEHFTHRAFAPGRHIGIVSGGAVIWQGRMETPTRGVPWTCTAIGVGAMGADYVAVAADRLGGMAINIAIDNAIGRGLPWTRQATLPHPQTNTPSGQSTIADVLSEASTTLGYYWTVRDDGEVRMDGPPVGVRYTVLALSNPGGRTSTGFATAAAVQWVSTNPPHRTVTSLTGNPEGIKRFGRIEAPLDLTQMGQVNDATQTAAGKAWLALRNPRTFFSGDLVLNEGQLCNPGGAPADLASVRPGRYVRVHWTDLNPFGEIDPTIPIDIIIGHTSYDSDAETLTVTPLDSSNRSINETRMVHRTHAWRDLQRRLAKQRAEAEAARKRRAAYLKWYRRTHHGHNPPAPRKHHPRKRKTK